jgi:hypothetical protein
VRNFVAASNHHASRKSAPADAIDWQAQRKPAVLTLGPLDAGLQTNSRQRQNPLKNGPQADQHHKQFEKIGQPAISNELIDGPKADRADHDDN